MAVEYTYSDMQVDELLGWVTERSRDGWRFVQLCATQCDEGADLMYTLRNGALVESRTLHGVGQEDHIPSITETFLEAFVFENEAHDLFGIQIDGIAIDFKGNFYRLALDKPMTIESPEKRERKEKAAKAAAAKAAKAAKAAQEAAADAKAAPAADPDAALEAKLAAMPPEKAAKVRAALAAKAAKEAAADAKAAPAAEPAAEPAAAPAADPDAALEAKLAAMPPEKAAKVRAALAAKAAREAAASKSGEEAAR